ncbi:MAG: hypothetical protein HPY45_16250 [Anaerolineae bacterium]|nr:hypothetical protein [Anaerolineae bacterium]
MAENMVSGVNRVDIQNAQAMQQQTQQMASARQQVAKPKEANTKARLVDVEKKEEPPAESFREEHLPIGKDTSLKFRVDAEKHEVTILIVDRATDKVIATIPPEAIKDLPPGELLNYPI